MWPQSWSRTYSWRTLNPSHVVKVWDDAAVHAFFAKHIKELGFAP